MADNELTFEELERRIRAMPEGPSGVLDMPGWARALMVLGAIGVVVGLLPSLLTQFMEPRAWMAHMAQAGVWIAVIGYAPGFLRNLWVLILGFLRWKTDLVRQLDHDLAQARELNRWLVGFPKEALEDHARFAKHVEIKNRGQVHFPEKMPADGMASTTAVVRPAAFRPGHLTR